jgi:hypothetical protein
MAFDGLDLELSTMQNIATALAGLDAPARSRVLMWLRLRFDPDDALSVTPSEASAIADTTGAPLQMLSIPTAIADYDDTLAVGSLAEFFDCPLVTPSVEPPPPPATGRFSGFVAEFQDLARDWDHACDTLANEVQAPRVLPAAS